MVRPLHRSHGVLLPLAAWAVAICAIAGCTTLPAETKPAPAESAPAQAPEHPAVVSEAPPVDQKAAQEASALPVEEGSLPEQTRSIGLSEAIQMALESGLDLALSRAQHEAAQARAAAATKAFVPALDVGGGVARTDGLVQGSFGDFRDVNSRSVTAGTALGLRINIGALVYEAIAARRDADAALLDSMAAQQQLILHVIELYENLVLAQVARDVSQQLVKSSEEFEHIASERYNAGVGTGADAARAQANLAANRQQLVQAENLWNNTSVRLAVVLRLDPEVLLVPLDTTIEPWQLPPGIESDAYAEDASNRPDVEAARQRADASHQLARARWWNLVAPELTTEWRLTGVGGEGSKARTETGPALSSAAGSAGRSVSAWQNAAGALATPGADPFPALSSAAGSGGRAFYAYRNFLGTTQQDVDGLERQERYGIWLNWNLSFAKADRIREQRAAARIADLKAAKAEDAAVAEVRQAQHDIQSAGQLIALSKDEITAAETNHRLGLARFTAGTAIAFEVLDAQDTLAGARLKLARYTTELNIAQARLLAAAGTIEASAGQPSGSSVR